MQQIKHRMSEFISWEPLVDDGGKHYVRARSYGVIIG